MLKLYNIVWHAVSRKLRDSQIPVGLACTRYHRWLALVLVLVLVVVFGVVVMLIAQWFVCESYALL
jgi:hypothetical protein